MVLSHCNVESKILFHLKCSTTWQTVLEVVSIYLNKCHQRTLEGTSGSDIFLQLAYTYVGRTLAGYGLFLQPWKWKFSKSHSQSMNTLRSLLWLSIIYAPKNDYVLLRVIVIFNLPFDYNHQVQSSDFRCPYACHTLPCLLHLIWWIKCALGLNFDLGMCNSLNLKPILLGWGAFASLHPSTFLSSLSFALELEVDCFHRYWILHKCTKKKIWIVIFDLIRQNGTETTSTYTLWGKVSSALQHTRH